MTQTSSPARGALAGLRVVEFAGMGPAPFACMMLSDMGADVVTIDRPGAKLGDPTQLTSRGRTVLAADLKDPAARERVMALVAHADVLVEGFRPGVMERLGLGPADTMTRNPRLVYGRMTGWGQTGMLAHTAGHDIAYVAITGALHAIGPADAPAPPLNLVGDFGGGSLYLIMGILAALLERHRSGKGQVVDAAIVDGVLSLMTLFQGMALRGQFVEQRESNMLDGGTPYYDTYATSDGQHVAIGSLEPGFFATLCEKIGMPADLRAAQNDRARWPEQRAAFARIFATRTRDEWRALLEDSDACFAGVLSLSEAARHPHLVAREAFVEVDGVMHIAPAPRFSRTPSQIQSPPAKAVSDIEDVMQRWQATA